MSIIEVSDAFSHYRRNSQIVLIAMSSSKTKTHIPQMQDGLCSAQPGQYSENHITYTTPLFTDKETESQRYCVTCPRSHSGMLISLMWELRFGVILKWLLFFSERWGEKIREVKEHNLYLALIFNSCFMMQGLSWCLYVKAQIQRQGWNLTISSSK